MSSAIRNSVKTIMWTLLLVFGSLIHAQDGVLPRRIDASKIEEVELPIELLDVNDGLSQGYTGTLLEDKAGYLWIATMDGLNRYDGYQFKTFRHDPQDSLSVASNSAAPVVTRSGLLIMTTYGGTVDLFDPNTETFQHFPLLSHQSKGLRGMGFGPPQVLPDGSVIVSTGEQQWDILLPKAGTQAKRPDDFTVLPLETQFPGLKQP